VAQAETFRFRSGIGLFVPAAGFAIPIPGALAASAAGLLRPGPALVVIAVAAVCTGLRTAAERLRMTILRERADNWIATHSGRQPADDVVRARMNELVSPRARIELGSRFIAVGEEALARSSRPVSPVYLNRRSVCLQLEPLSELAEALRDVETPISPRGVALAKQLLTHSGGPLYRSDRAVELATTIGQVLSAIRRPSAG
jgi:hypothetical protein